MNIKEIQDILKMLEGTDISEFELEKSSGKVKIKRCLYSSTVVPEVEVEKRGTLPPAKKELAPEDLKTITSPMVGTFYRSPSPDAPPFVEEGSMVKKGQVLCVIEAMKLMNEVEAEFNGKLISILVENAHPVEYGEPLFLIDPK
ncbi:MAG: acetyl-CoA carboxylase biotin carboxyl carrier protein [Thermodesulfobacteriota bacterium]